MKKSLKHDLALYGRLLAYIKHLWPMFILVILANVIYAGIEAGMFKLLEPLIDDVFVEKDASALNFLIGMLLIAFVLRGVMGFSANYGIKWLSSKLVLMVRSNLFHHLQALPASFYDAQSSGQLLAKLTYNCEQVAQASADIITDAFRAVVLIVGLLIVMLTTSWQLTLLFLSISPIVIILFRLASVRFRVYNERIQNTLGDYANIAEENIENYRVVKLFGAKQYETRRFDQVLTKNRTQILKLALVQTISSPVIQTLAGVSMVAAIYGAFHWFGDEITPGVISVLVGAMIALQRPVKDLTRISSRLQAGLAGAESVFEILDIPVEQNLGTYQPKQIEGRIRFEGVSFSYNKSLQPALSDINLDIKAGQTIALVGHSGSGKSTLISLLPRFYLPTEGCIYLDDKPIDNFEIMALRSKLALVTQNVTLFNETVASNIALGVEHDLIDNERLNNALELAYAKDFVNKLPEKEQTLIGENGVSLSGGQRQRLAIARAIYKDSPVIIFDEATSALDTQSEKMVQKAMQDLFKGRTNLVVAHRLSTIENADKIIVMNEGKRVEVGAHQELLANKSHYYDLHSLQYQAAHSGHEAI